MKDKIIHLNDNNFEKYVLKNSNFVLVDFWAEWCGPCKILSPILHEIVNEYQNALTITQLNIDKNPNIASKYGIRSIPTLLVFKNGKIVATKIGALSKKQLKDFLDSNLI